MSRLIDLDRPLPSYTPLERLKIASAAGRILREYQDLYPSRKTIIFRSRVKAKEYQKKLDL